MVLRCKICGLTLEKRSDINRMDSTGEFNPLEVIRTLTFIVLSGNAKYLICKKCKGKLKTLKNHRENVCKAEEELRCMHRSINQEDESASNRLATSTSVCGPETSTTVYTSPGKRTLATELSEESMNENKKTKLSAQSYSPKAVQTNLTFNVDKSASVACFIHVCWPSCDRSRKLQDDLVKIGVSLLRGTYKEIALSLWKHPEIRNNLIALLLKEVNKECESMCRDRIPQPVSPLEIHKREPKDKKRDRLNMFDARSILKKTTKQDMLLFSFEKLDSEMQESWPLFRSVLMTACSRRSNARKQDLYWQAAVCTTGSVCLKNRSQRMTALQLYISLIVNNSSYTVSWHLNVVSRVFIKYVTSHNRITFYIFISVFCFIEI